MMDAWFSPETARLFSYLSMLSLCALFTVPTRKGQLRKVATGVWAVATGLAVLLLALGGFASAAGQPAHVGRSLLLSGSVLGLVFAATWPSLIRGYRESELRRTVAADL